MARPPVCKLMDYGKFKYENAQKAREARRNQTNTVIKEMKLRPKIDQHDYETKKGHVVRFLQARATRSRSRSCSADVSSTAPSWGSGCCSGWPRTSTELGFVESSPKQDGRNMIMVLGPAQEEVRGQGRGEGGEGRSGPPRARPSVPRSTPSVVRPTPRRRRRRSAEPLREPRPRDRRVTRRRTEDQMPKNKTHSGASKRFRVTGSGKIRRQKAGLRHNLEKKPSKLTRRMSGTTERRQGRRQARQEAARSLTASTPRSSSCQGVLTMARVKRAVNAQKKRRVVLERASGYRGQRSRLYRKAKEQVTHSLVYSYRDRASKKGDFRKLWIQRINAARPRQRHDLQPLHPGPQGRAGVEVDRKILADLAVNDAPAFAALVEIAKAALPEDVNAPATA